MLHWTEHVSVLYIIKSNSSCVHQNVQNNYIRTQIRNFKQNRHSWIRIRHVIWNINLKSLEKFPKWKLFIIEPRCLQTKSVFEFIKLLKLIIIWNPTHKVSWQPIKLFHVIKLDCNSELTTVQNHWHTYDKRPVDMEKMHVFVRLVSVGVCVWSL